MAGSGPSSLRRAKYGLPLVLNFGQKSDTHIPPSHLNLRAVLELVLKGR